MDHVAIDLGGRESQICVRRSDGTILEERRCPTKSLARVLATRAPSRVILETCAEAFAVADQVKALGHEVVVVPATLARTLGVGAKGQKTDVRDARALSKASCALDEMPRVHIPSLQARQWKSVAGMRETLVESRTMLINTVRGWLRGQLERVRSGGVTTLPQRVREHFSTMNKALPAHLERQLVTIELLTTQIAEADKDVERLAQGDPRCVRLMSVPGVGPVTSVRFVAAVDEVGRFPSAHALESYLGLVPGQDSSSERVRRTGITKAGPAELRRVLIQACWTMRRVRPGDPLSRWAKDVEGRRGSQVAVTAMARKLAGILFALWRDGTVYQPQRSSTLGAKLQAEELARHTAYLAESLKLLAAKEQRQR